MVLLKLNLNIYKNAYTNKVFRNIDLQFILRKLEWEKSSCEKDGKATRGRQISIFESKSI